MTMVERVGDPPPTQQAVIACARWLQACLSLGWEHTDLDFLEMLWWKHHDYRGRLNGSRED
jgi:hypothetical protein